MNDLAVVHCDEQTRLSSSFPDLKILSITRDEHEVDSALLKFRIEGPMQSTQNVLDESLILPSYPSAYAPR